MQQELRRRALGWSKALAGLFALAAFALAPATILFAQSTGATDGYQAKFVDVNGARTRYYDAGSSTLRRRPAATGRRQRSMRTPVCWMILR